MEKKEKKSTKKKPATKKAVAKKPRKPKTSNRKPTKTKLLELAETKFGNVLEMSRACKVPRSTMYNWIDKDDDLKKAIVQSRDILIDMAETSLARNVRKGNEKSVIYTLSTLGRNRGFGNIVSIQDRSKLDDQLDGMSEEQIMEAMERSRNRIKKAMDE